MGKGENDARLTPDQVSALRRARLAGASSDSLAERFGVSPTTIRKALYCRSPYDHMGSPGPLAITQADPALTTTQVREARGWYLRGTSADQIARSFGVPREMLRRALLGLPPYERIRRPNPVKPGRDLREG